VVDGHVVRHEVEEEAQPLRVHARAQPRNRLVAAEAVVDCVVADRVRRRHHVLPVRLRVVDGEPLGRAEKSRERTPRGRRGVRAARCVLRAGVEGRARTLAAISWERRVLLKRPMM